jgi:lysozyme
MNIRGRIVAGIAALALTIAGGTVTRFEGTRYSAYADAAGVWTICEGHTQGVKPGDTATPEQCTDYRNADLLVASDGVDSCVHVPLSVGERAAFVDFAFNVGVPAFCRSTLTRKLNSGDHAGACQELMRWTYAGGKQLPGLIARRDAERQLCKGQAWLSYSAPSSAQSSAR